MRSSARSWPCRAVSVIGFVRQRCADNPAMERRVRKLVAASENRPMMNCPVLSKTARDSLWRMSWTGDDGEDLSGQRIDEWRIVSAPGTRRPGHGLPGRGAKGGSFEQKAALKVLRRGLDTDDVVARFRAERQILSTLEHPSIARILDGGALDDGRPYLVLEFVDGLPITRYCEDNDVDIRGRGKAADGCARGTSSGPPTT